jgi:hypothetical protein
MMHLIGSLLPLLAFVPLHNMLLPQTPAAAVPAIASHLKVQRASQLSMQQSDRPDDEEHWTHEDDMGLQSQIARQSTIARLGHPDEVLESLKAAFVLIFNPGQTDEGVYTLQGRATSASAYVLAFERTEDGSRFAELLRAEGFDQATLVPWDKMQFNSFCSAGMFEVSLVPTGTLIVPPSKNEYDHDAFEKLSNPDSYAAERALLERLMDM